MYDGAMATPPGDLPALTVGNIHMGIGVSGAVARIWPTPDPDLWHVGLAGYPPRATEEPVRTERVAELLVEWGFRAESWTHWPGPIYAENPDLRMVRQGPNWSSE
jgi:hypothetical protein